MSNVDADAGDIIGLVYLNAFAPDRGESCFSLAALFPGSTLGDALVRAATARPIYIDPDRFHDQFCADVAAAQAGHMAATRARDAEGAHRAVGRATAVA